MRETTDAVVEVLKGCAGAMAVIGCAFIAVILGGFAMFLVGVW